MYLDVEFIRIGTCGGVGVEAGTICVTRRGYTQRIGNGPKFQLFYFFYEFSKISFFLFKIEIQKKRENYGKKLDSKPNFPYPKSYWNNNLLDILNFCVGGFKTKIIWIKKVELKCAHNVTFLFINPIQIELSRTK